MALARPIDVDAPTVTALRRRESRGDDPRKTAVRADMPHHARRVRVEGSVGRADDDAFAAPFRGVHLDLAIAQHRYLDPREHGRILRGRGNGIADPLRQNASVSIPRRAARQTRRQA